MHLRLKYEPTPKNAPRFSAEAVAAVKELAKVQLDYSPSSLHHVDRIIEQFRTDHVPLDKLSETLFGLGSYVGEVFVRYEDGEWRPTATTPLAKTVSVPIVVQLSETRFCNPIDKVYSRFTNGNLDNLAFFYRVMTGKPLPEMPKAAAKPWWKLWGG